MELIVYTLQIECSWRISMSILSLENPPLLGKRIAQKKEEEE